MGMLIKNGNVVMVEDGKIRKMDVLIDKGIIVEISPEINRSDVEVIDIEGKFLIPGLIDMHVHFRDPGYTHKEDIHSGSNAALAGGFTGVLMMPNTDPPPDNATVIYYWKEKSKSIPLNILFSGCITKNRAGKELSKFYELKEAGAVAITDDGNWVADGAVFRHAMEYAAALDLLVITHPEEPTIANRGVINEGYWSTVLGLRGIPKAAENIAIYRDIEIAKMTGAKLHVAHLSTAEGVRLVAAAKKLGLKVTAEVTPHHLVLTDEALAGYDTNLKVNPPLREAEEQKALLKGLLEGVIDVIATDHAPHASYEKNVEFNDAPFGIEGLETAFPVLYTELVLKKKITLEKLLLKMTVNPAKILQLPKQGDIKKGNYANLTVIDPKLTLKVSEELLVGKSKNNPFLGRTLTGWPVMTVYQGIVAYQRLLKGVQ
ncbi:dihydroorotase [Carboxydothermus hydrogenoformans Z-2901]|uniref:Dihydroorotase n=2 Tax=Carboxydothermus hydrogenoformans TaxID=129958 RepID=PYRC_CARHZ|nr:RecName: Full=Dihydroorotase; Short=DHOase [Carboxydothermus hydrogenoformans Z-2901]ABB14270.1 dihydroorotase [Carboxydothermus hydrogenoformans Z-2901]